MLKKLLIIFSFITISTIFCFSNGLFKNEEVNVVSKDKSLGVISTLTNTPFLEKSGVYKAFKISYDYEKLIKNLNAKLVIKENLDGLTCFYYYSKKLPEVEIIKGKKVNLHIAVSNNRTVIGSPIIYGSF
ncbi:MAG: hypothetical protein J6Q38_01165 [Clostridia bacterium]|nr:hypothetical protein [Clostridia bacterium]